MAALLGQHLVKLGPAPPSLARNFAALLGLRSQAAYNRHFLLDRASIDEELERVNGVFAILGPFLASRDVHLPEQ